MARVTGIGGIFLKARDPQALAAWYAKHLGIELSAGHHGKNFLWSDEVHAIVDHGGLQLGAEVGGVGGEQRPDGHAGGGGDLVGPEEGGAAVVGEGDAEVFDVPG